MSQKVNPIGFRVGVSQNWNTQMQCYQKTSLTYTLTVLKKLQIFSFFQRLLFKHNIILSKAEWLLKDGSIYCDLFYTKYEPLTRQPLLEISKKILKVLKYWITSPFVFRFYKIHWFSNPTTVSHWICYQLEKKQNIKWILLLLKKKKINYQKWNTEIKYDISGENAFLLKGIKIICSGRLRGRRNRMSSKTWKQVGVMPLQRLHGFVEYKKDNAYTRFGKIGVHVYYYYAKHLN
uniref:ribosomal protein S3 n=1 Tax=Madagascaria erythrocladioides TaxID=753684 RepID=UPI001FCE1721|nr:ribosomal protein S3 [Madagascaria erythrocladioides]UNJ18792.1 ribosomal protein S3 [Madagascaria erythrocladioides]